MPIAGRLALAALATSLLTPLDARAATHEVASRIEAVTVQVDRAVVTRRATVEAVGGGDTLVFPDLPVGLDPASLQLVTATEGAVLGRAVWREVQTVEPASPTVRRLTEELERLERQRRVERDGVAVQELLLDVLRRSQLVVEPGDGDRLSDAAGLFGMVENRGKEALQAIRAAEQAIDRLDAEIDRQKRELARLGEDPRRRLELAVPVTAGADGPIELTLSYAVQGAGFRPEFEARLDVGARTVRFIASAEVAQATGEDWQDVDLALSTATPSWRTAAPGTDTWYIDVARDEPQRFERLATAPAMPMAADAVGGVALDFSGFDVAYRIEGPQSVASDGTTRRVTIESVELPVELVWRAVPAFDTTAFLTASATYDGEAPLLPGSLRLYRDDVSVGESRLDGLQPGAPLELGFGADPAIEIEHRLLTDQRAQTGLIGTSRRHERRYAIEATNRRREAVTLEVIDRLPVSRDSRITVELLPETTPPTTDRHDGDEGVLAWNRELAPGEAATITFAYAVRHPADVNVTGF